jgi:hypothetical protein
MGRMPFFGRGTQEGMGDEKFAVFSLQCSGKAGRMDLRFKIIDSVRGSAAADRLLALQRVV